MGRGSQRGLSPVKGNAGGTLKPQLDGLLQVELGVRGLHGDLPGPGGQRRVTLGRRVPNFPPVGTLHPGWRGLRGPEFRTCPLQVFGVHFALIVQAARRGDDRRLTVVNRSRDGAKGRRRASSRGLLPIASRAPDW